VTSTVGAGLKSKVNAAGAASTSDVKALQSEISEMKLNMDTLEKERDFYFGKLRDIEMLLQANPSH
jgi:RP/EB family microtubule-associated protein